MGNTVVNISNLSIKNCYAKGAGGGLYFDPCYDIDSMNYYLFPTSQYIIYKNNIFKPEIIQNEYEYKYNSITDTDSDSITLKSNNSWYYNDIAISDYNEKYGSIPNIGDDTYIHGYIKSNGSTESVVGNIDLFN